MNNSKYEYELLPVKDADAILIRHFIEDKQYIIVIDAGNEGDGIKIKNHILKYFHTPSIDLAICTHPDKDHKDGFFDLLNDADVKIKTLWLTDPAEYLTEDDLKKYQTRDSASRAVRRIWNKSNDDRQNLICLACCKNVNIQSVVDGMKHSYLPIRIVGPKQQYYSEVVKDMVANYGILSYDTSEKTKYDAMFQISEEEAKSKLDEKEDASPFNASSLIVLYEPENGKQFLFAGDANTTSLQMMLDKYPEIKDVYLLKVPHHGSKRNLNTKIIDTLAPKISYISASGTLKHPSRSVVYWLSKYGPVYSTHKCNGYLHSCHGDITKREGSVPIPPLRDKM